MSGAAGRHRGDDPFSSLIKVKQDKLFSRASKVEMRDGAIAAKQANIAW
jgi:hypothetical protein